LPDAIAVIGQPITPQEIQYWTTEADFQNVLHVEQLQDLSASDGLSAKPFCIEGIQRSDVGALAYFNTDTGNVSARFGFQIDPVLGLSQRDDKLWICLTGWCDDAPTLDQVNPNDCDVCEDPCTRYARLRCKLDALVCGESKASVSFRDRSVTFNRANMDVLERMVNEARRECEGRGRSFGRRFCIDTSCTYKRPYC
jgi:hypothetical protein